MILLGKILVGKIKSHLFLAIKNAISYICKVTFL